MQTKRVAFITGGSRGIGYGIAVEMAKAGFDLAIKSTQANLKESILPTHQRPS